MTRFDLQGLVLSSIRTALHGADVPLDADHCRRLQRALLRCASRVAIDSGMPVDVFAATTVQAFADELRTKYPATLTRAAVPSELN